MDVLFNPTTLAILALTAWSLLLVALLLCNRSLHLFIFKRQIETFTPDNKGVSGFAERLSRAHANSVENLPISIGTLLLAQISGMSEITNPLALTFVGARVLQTCVHLSGTTPIKIWIRVFFFSIQCGICFYWALQLYLAGQGLAAT